MDDLGSKQMVNVVCHREYKGGHGDCRYPCGCSDSNYVIRRAGIQGLYGIEKMNTIILSALKYLAPYAGAMALGFSAAWYVQGIRIDASNNQTAEVKLEFSNYIAEAKQAQLNEQMIAAQQQKESGERYEILRLDLERSNASNDTYRRCISAGKCNGMRVSTNLCQTGTVQAATGTDATGSDTIPAAGIDAAVVNDCAKTTLQINQLQSDIKRQRGY